jgi:hypothetical protein
VLDAERLCVAGLKLHTALDEADADESSGPSLEELRATMQQRPSRKGKQREADDETYEVFYERMRLTEEFEGLLTALYRDFLNLRLGTAFDSHVLPALQRWARGAEVDAEAYATARKAALEPGAARRATQPVTTSPASA